MKEPISYSFGEGQTLLALPTDRYKSEFLTVQYALPLDAAAQERALVLALLCRGSASYPTQLALNRRFDTLYSTVLSVRNRRVGDMQLMGYAMDFLGRRYVGGEDILLQAVETLADVMCRPLFENGAFRSSYVTLEKNNLRDAVRAAINNPRGYALAECRKLLCAGEPYGLSLLGEEETISAVTPETLAAKYRAFVPTVRPIFFYVGAEDPARVAACLERAFTGLGTKKNDYHTVVQAAPAECRSAEKEMPLCQGKLVLGFRTPITYGHPLDAALLVLNEILGGSPASKLFLNVREAKSLCYTCLSSVDIYKGVLFAQAGMKPENRTVTEEAMLEQFDAIAAGDISKTELDAALSSLDFAYRQSDNAPALLADVHLNRRIAGIAESRAAWHARVAAVTHEDVVAAAREVRLGARYFLNGTLPEGEVEE